MIFGKLSGNQMICWGWGGGLTSNLQAFHIGGVLKLLFAFMVQKLGAPRD